MTSQENGGLYVEVKDAQKLLAIYQHKDWWVRPAFSDCPERVPARTQLLLIRKNEGYQIILAVSTTCARTDIEGKQGGVLLTVSSDRAGQEPFYITDSGDNPYELCRNAVKKALEQTGRIGSLRENRSYPEIFEYLGWCSWDAFYHQVSQRGIIDKLTEFQRKGLPVRWVLIDDGWLDADYEERTLLGPDADRSKFPQGLGACAERMKRDFGISWTGVWHSVMGYWDGLKEDSAAHRAVRSHVERTADGRLVVGASAKDAFSFFDAWHGYLKNRCGIDFVKVDGQSSISRIYEETDRQWSASAEILKGLGASAALHFHNNIINCMGMAAEDVWNRPGGALSRSSDDFVPDTERGFCEHALQNSYNCLWQGQLFWGDWDMFFSEHRESVCNSMLRALSGGPVYTSDRVGRTDPACIWPLIRKDGRIIRCEDTGMPTTDCLFDDPREKGRILKVFNRSRESYVIAAFHIADCTAPAQGRTSTADIPGLSGKEWYVYAWRSKKLYALSDGSFVDFSLEPLEAELFYIVPAREICVVGILEKYVCGGCVERVSHMRGRTVIGLEEGGTLGFVSGKAPKKVLCGGREIPFTVAENSGMVKRPVFCRAECVESEEGGCLAELIWEEGGTAE